VSARVSIAVLMLGIAVAGPAMASDEGYIYGRVETTAGRTYQGQIRWGTEESFWDDIFNATKEGNENLDYLNYRDLERMRTRKWGPLAAFGFDDPTATHVFAIRFGDLKRIEVRRGEHVIAEFRNGEELELGGGSNDVGARLTVMDGRRGKQEIAWNRIRTVEFLPTPARLEDKLGQPLYGTVKSGTLEFTGRIQWDNDEALSIDELDGQTDEGKAHVVFEDIESIRKHRRGALVTLRSGSELYMTGTNDVNDGNRGVVVVVPGLGSVKVGWDDFDEVTFRRAPHTGPSYADFARGRHLSGTVVTRSGRYEGRLVYDLDESRDFELLQGKNGDTEYLIPFRDIVSIKPEGGMGAVVEVRLGMRIELDDSQDVTRKNDGVLVFEGRSEPRYVAWRDVREVRFH
jgi:hypothetical protein